LVSLLFYELSPACDELAQRPFHKGSLTKKGKLWTGKGGVGLSLERKTGAEVRMESCDKTDVKECNDHDGSLLVRGVSNVEIAISGCGYGKETCEVKKRLGHENFLKEMQDRTYDCHSGNKRKERGPAGERTSRYFRSACGTPCLGWSLARGGGRRRKRGAKKTDICGEGRKRWVWSSCRRRRLGAGKKTKITKIGFLGRSGLIKDAGVLWC